MTVEQSLVLTALSDFCHCRSTEKPSDSVDLDTLFKISNEHSLDSILYIQCRRWMGLNAAVKRFEKTFQWHVFYSVNRKDFLREITDRFGKQGISFVCMKGAVFRNSYPIPEIRTMGDIDLIISPEDRIKADRILMQEMGFNRMIDNHAVWTYWIGPFQFEVHDHMFYEYLANRYDYRGYFDHIWEHVHHEAVFGIEADNLLVPDLEFHFLYLIAHTAKHIINNGSGFRAYLDMVMLVKNYRDKMNWVWIEDELRKMQLLSFAKTCFALCERWFNVSMPIEHGDLDETFFETVTHKTFQDGVFGLDNLQNEASHSAKEIKRSRYPYWITALKITVHHLFPPYSDLQLIPWYSFIDGRPYLLPFAWIYRWWYCLLYKRKSALLLLTEPFTKKQVIEKRKELIYNWGL